jgi:hypothetical protein
MPKRTEENKENFSQDNRCPTEIRTGHLPNKSQKRYYLRIDLLGKKVLLTQIDIFCE